MTALATEPQPVASETSIAAHKHWGAPIALTAIALISLIAFGLGTAGDKVTNFAFARGTDFFAIPAWTAPSRTVAIIGSVVGLALAAVAARYASQTIRVPRWIYPVFGIAIMVAVLTWAGAGRSGSVSITALLTGAVMMSVPLVLGALAGVICERSGVVNIAIEGQLLFGAFLAAVVSSATGNPYLGLIFAPIAGALVGALLALFAVKYWVDQIVVGVVLNVLVVGITSFLFGTLLRQSPELNQATSIPTLPIPVLSKIPVIGPVLFNHTALVYAMYVVVIVLHIMLYRSRWGLRVRAVGEHPKAADSVGIKVNRTRVRNVILGGAIAGLGGAYFTVAAGLAFGKDMTSGKGFIALAAMILGRWSPKGALAAALLFGFAEALKQNLGIIGSTIPSQFLAMLPYLATLFAVAGLVGHVKGPAAAGKPYKK